MTTASNTSRSGSSRKGRAPRKDKALLFSLGEVPTCIRACLGRAFNDSPKDPQEFASVRDFAQVIKDRSNVTKPPLTIDKVAYKAAKEKGVWIMNAIDESVALIEDDNGERWSRKKGAVTECTFLKFDVDRARYRTYDNVRRFLKDHGIAFVMYRTTGDGLKIKGGIDGECFRVFLPCDTVAADVAEAVTAYLRGKFEERFTGCEWDASADQPTRIMYLPAKGVNVDTSDDGAPGINAADIFKANDLTLIKSSSAGLERGIADAGYFRPFVDWCLTNVEGAIEVDVRQPDGTTQQALQMPGQQPDKYSDGADGGDGWRFYYPSGQFSMLVFKSLHENTEPSATFKVQDAVNVLCSVYGTNEPAELYVEAKRAALIGEPLEKDCSSTDADSDVDSDDAKTVMIDWYGDRYGLITGEKSRALTEGDFKQLEEINEHYAMVTVGGKVMIALSQRGDFGDRVEFMPVKDLPVRLGGCGTVYGWKKEDGKVKAASPINVATAWLNWSRMRRFDDGVTFAPGEGDQGTRLNLWQGYAVRPRAGDVSLWLNHLEKVICNGDKDNARYLLQYLAHMVQRPQEKPSVSVTLRTEGKGAGKDLFLKPLLTMFGNHAILLNDTNQVTGRFNAVLEGKILITLNEAQIHSHSQLQKFKTVVSEPTAPIERKGVDIMQIRNFARLISTTNHEDAIKVEKGERRQFMLACSEEYAVKEGDERQESKRKAYFDPLVEWTRNGGASRLLKYLQEVDISDFNPFTCPATDELNDAILLNMDPFESWLVDIADNHRTISSDGVHDAVKKHGDDGQYRFYVNKLAEHFATRLPKTESDRKVQTKVGMALSKMGFTTKRDSGNAPRYFVTSIDALREKVAKYVGQDVDKLFNA